MNGRSFDPRLRQGAARGEEPARSEEAASPGSREGVGWPAADTRSGSPAAAAAARLGVQTRAARRRRHARTLTCLLLHARGKKKAKGCQRTLVAGACGQPPPGRGGCPGRAALSRDLGGTWGRWRRLC
ncbi:hypothetical protein HPB48_020159 [Haemaphysalis longicornis]|uniref:Uncharacterized protein n=1 Tax=Haemaphysalis longicornis TaxID=44386 RepID=A0A9J6FHZ1_HAELO|nr:hypothetical protein HPB48_020159 [Haemaphysalis longicornis]